MAAIHPAITTNPHPAEIADSNNILVPVATVIKIDENVIICDKVLSYTEEENLQYTPPLPLKFS